MIGDTWSHIQRVMEYACAGVSFALNSFLVFLILRHSPKTLGPYKYLMMYISVFELFYSIMNVIVSPIFHSYGSTFLVMVNVKESMFDLKTCLLLASIYCGCFGSSMAIFGIHFIYRYLIVTGSNLLGTFQTWKITVWFLIPIIYGAIWGSMAYGPVGQKPATGEHIRKNIMETFGLEVNETAYIGPYFYQEKPDGKFEIDISSIVASSVVYFIVSSSFYTIIYFGVKCYSKIRELTPSSNAFKSRAMQSKLFWALVIQTLIPVVLLHLPVSIVYAFALLDKDIGMLSGLVSITIAAYPAVDPLPTLLIIPHYRAAFLYYLRCCKGTIHVGDDETSNSRQIELSNVSHSRVVPLPQHLDT